jgi:hypothetical protein
MMKFITKEKKKNLYPVITETDIDTHCFTHQSLFFTLRLDYVRVPTSKFILFFLSLFCVIVNVVVFCL